MRSLNPKSDKFNKQTNCTESNNDPG